MSEVLRVGVGLLFATGGILKLFALREFRASIQAYGVARPLLATILAGCVTVLELAIGIALAVRLFFPISAIAAILTLVAFTAVVAVAIIAGKKHGDCGCMVFGRGRVGWYICFRNIALASLLLPSSFAFPPFATTMAAIALLIASAVTMNSEDVRIHTARTGMLAHHRR